MASRGEVWLVDLGMTAKVRPALVISVPPTDADRALVTLVPHTTSVRQSGFETAFTVGFLKAGAFDAQGLVTVPPVRLLRRLGKNQRPGAGGVQQSVAWRGIEPPRLRPKR